MPRLLAITLLLALPGLAAPARAWGDLGHQVIAEIAAARLSPVARAEVERLLGEPAPQALREAANWADQVRDWDGGRSAPLHYVNFPRSECRYVARRDCRGGRCLVAALERNAGALAAATPAQARADALRWLVHLVGDAQQPLHAAWRDDRGGNDVQLRYQGRGTNLHALADRDLLRDRGLRAGDYARAIELEQARPPAASLAWDARAPARWAEESCALAASLYPAGRRVDPAWAARTRGLLEQRLYLAGLRLAAALNALLDPAPP